MVACGALRVTWLSGLMESGRPSNFRCHYLSRGGGGEAEGFVWGGVTREDLLLSTGCKGGTIEH